MKFNYAVAVLLTSGMLVGCEEEKCISNTTTEKVEAVASAQPKPKVESTLSAEETASEWKNQDGSITRIAGVET